MGTDAIRGSSVARIFDAVAGVGIRDTGIGAAARAESREGLRGAADEEGVPGRASGAAGDRQGFSRERPADGGLNLICEPHGRSNEPSLPPLPLTDQPQARHH